MSNQVPASHGTPRPAMGVAAAMLAALGCAVDGRGATYVSAPITTGWRFVAWSRGPGCGLAPDGPAHERERYRREHYREVVLPNREDVVPVVRHARRVLGGTVIDPTRLEMPGWSQGEYHRFWVQVVERYARAVVLVDGWQYSSGCAYEYVAALRSGAGVLRQDLTPLPPSEGKRLIESAIEDLADGVLPTEPLREALDELGSAAVGLGPGIGGLARRAGD